MTSAGVEQVHQLGRELFSAGLNIDQIHSSDLRRARETAVILSGYLKLPIELMPGFRETNNGDLAGMENELAKQKYPGLFWSALEYDECYPNGESPAMFYERIKGAWVQFKEKAMKNSDKDFLLVTHGGVIEVILCIENGLTFTNKRRNFAIPNAKLITVEL